MSEVINLMDPAFRNTPYPSYGRLRQLDTLSRVEPLNMWAVARFDHVTEVLKDPQRFSSAAYTEAASPEWLGRNPLLRTIAMIDPPDHTRLRALVSRAFTPAAVSQMESELRVVAEQLVGPLLEQKEVDFVRDFALPLPARIMARLLGVDSTLHTRFKQWSDDLLSIPSPVLTPEQKAQIKQTVSDMEGYFSEVIAARRRKPEADLVTALVQAEADGTSLNHDELIAFMFVLLLAGLETTVHLLDNMMLTLSNHPRELRRLIADHRLIPNVIEEILRYEPPLGLVLRRATRDTQLSGTSIKEGEILVVLLAAALRDERYYPDGDTFNIDRDKPTNLFFGHGIHFCLGAPLARLEARVALETLLPRIRGFRRLQEKVDWNIALNTRGPTSLRLRFEPA